MATKKAKSKLEKNIIGYDSVKKEFAQLVDMIKNPELYTSLGARLPKGVLLNGPPGTGKSTICRYFVEDCGIPSYIIRRDSNSDDFVDKITITFEKAKQNAPSIIWAEDIDHWANDDERHRDAPEYICLQANIDGCFGYDVMVIATANESERFLPSSLLRPGRFDRTITVSYPSITDAVNIAQHYMKGKKIAPGLNIEDVVKAIGCDAASVIETILNESAIYAAFDHSDCIQMNHILAAILRQQYNSPDDTSVLDMDEVKEIALHEAGHIVVSEVLIPGSVGLASIRSRGHNNKGGFTHRCKPITRRPFDVMISLGGKVAVELNNPKTASGCQSDLGRALEHIEDGMADNATLGMSLLDGTRRNSDALLCQQESAARAELERYLKLCRELLIKNKDFLEKCSNALIEKETLLYSDIQAIKGTCEVVGMEV